MKVICRTFSFVRSAGLAAFASTLAIESALPQRTAPAATPPPVDRSAELDALRQLRWRAIGPANQAGRIAFVVGVPGNRNVYYVGSAAGGLIKTTNGGITFTHLFDDQEVASM
ncbi:MAG TPA: hypothetical protein VNL96_07760, partial [Gemmatimonadaceae bacterium]|nr:hypothetical protein [Gemmatimonadaceae bacterium]